MASAAATAALLESIETGTQQLSGVDASAELDHEKLCFLLDGIGAARKRAESEVCAISKAVAPSVDGWIRQAKQLQVDIKYSRDVAQEVVREAEDAEQLLEQRNDLGEKVALLEGEVLFNERLGSILNSLRDMTNKLAEGQKAASAGALTFALESLEDIEGGTRELQTFENTIALDLLHQRTQRLRDVIMSDAKQQWSTYFHVEKTAPRIIVNACYPSAASSVDDVVQALSKLSVLDSTIFKFSRDVHDAIFRPRMASPQAHETPVICVDRNSVSLEGRKPNTGSIDLIEDISAVVRFLNERLPQSVAVSISEFLIPPTVTRLCKDWLPYSIPLEMETMGSFDILLRRVTRLADDLAELGWHGGAELNEWVDQAPRIWLARRRESSLASVRMLLSKQLHHRKSVERTETQVVARGDAIAPVSGADEDWDAAWADDKEQRLEADTTIDANEDASAWDADDKPGVNGAGESSTDPSMQAAAEPDDDTAEAWGWDEPNTQSAPPSPDTARKRGQQMNGHKIESNNQEREVTLRETFTVTDVPDCLLDLIFQICKDAETLQQAEFSSSPVSSAASALFTLPTLTIAGYRALAPTYYQMLQGGNMLLYNDSIRLASTLSTSTFPPNASSRLDLTTDIAALESFSKRSYGREMDSQRTILRDLLDGAQGFAHCTEAPFKSECENAVLATSDRVRELAREWEGILSRSALLQSLGSLLGTVTGKMITDIEDLSDIGVDESTKLKELCDTVGKLSELFAQPGPDGKNVDMTGIYCPTYFKFLYLAEILDSSLADLNFLWTEGELKLEFEVEEVVDLVEALFADSSLRKNAIADIRRG